MPARNQPAEPCIGGKATSLFGKLLVLFLKALVGLLDLSGVHLLQLATRTLPFLECVNYLGDIKVSLYVHNHVEAGVGCLIPDLAKTVLVVVPQKQVLII